MTKRPAPAAAFVWALLIALSALGLAAPASAQNERSLMAEAAREEAELQRSTSVERDAALNAYAREVLCKVAADECAGIRLYLVRSPDFGARTLANGAMQIGVGLLWRSANEAQLAFVLARQSSHLAQRHPSREAAAEASLDHARVAIGALSIITTTLTGDLLNLGVNGVERQGDRSRERAADTLALDRLRVAGYDSADAIALSEALAAEADAGRFIRPSLREDIDIDRAGAASRGRRRALAADGASDAPGAPASNPAASDVGLHRQRIRPFLAQWLEADLQRRDFDASLFAFARLANHQDDLGLIYYYIAQAHRLRRQDGDLEAALQNYRIAISHADAPAVAWRELGEAEARAGAAPAAILALETYLSRASNPPDRALVEGRIAALRPR